MHRSLWGDFHYRITGKNADGKLQYVGGWQGAALRNIETDGDMSAAGAGSKDGVLLAEVKKGSGAEKMGLKPGDVILKIGDAKIRNLKDFAATYRQIKKGRQVRITVWRDQAERTLQIRKD